MTLDRLAAFLLNILAVVAIALSTYSLKTIVRLEKTVGEHSVCISALSKNIEKMDDEDHNTQLAVINGSLEHINKRLDKMDSMLEGSYYHNPSLSNVMPLPFTP